MFQWAGRQRHCWSMFERIKDVGHPDGTDALSLPRLRCSREETRRGNINKTAENRNIYQLVHPGWLVANRMKAWQGSVGISDLRGIVSGHYICFAPRHDADSRYLNWLFRSPVYVDGYAMQSRGVRIGQAEIDNDLYRLMPVLLPPIEEQRAIADYLDRETARIDTLIEEQQRLIEMLRERRSRTSRMHVGAATGLTPTEHVGDPAWASDSDGWPVSPQLGRRARERSYAGRSRDRLVDRLHIRWVSLHDVGDDARNRVSAETTAVSDVSDSRASARGSSARRAQRSSSRRDRRRRLSWRVPMATSQRFAALDTCDSLLDLSPLACRADAMQLGLRFVPERVNNPRRSAWAISRLSHPAPTARRAAAHRGVPRRADREDRHADRGDGAVHRARP